MSSVKIGSNVTKVKCFGGIHVDQMGKSSFDLFISRTDPAAGKGGPNY